MKHNTEVRELRSKATKVTPSVTKIAGYNEPKEVKYPCLQRYLLRWVACLVRNALTPVLSSSFVAEERNKPRLVLELRNDKWREGGSFLDAS